MTSQKFHQTIVMITHNNEIAQLNTGDTVEIIEKEDSTYWYVYVPKLGKEGYVDKNYLK